AAPSCEHAARLFRVFVLVFGVGVLAHRRLDVQRRLLGEVGLPVRAHALHARIGGAAGDRVGLVLVGVVDLLALDLDAAVLAVAERRRPELAGDGLLVALVALGAAEGLVLGLVVGPILELLGRVLLELLDLPGVAADKRDMRVRRA